MILYYVNIDAITRILLPKFIIFNFIEKKITIKIPIL